MEIDITDFDNSVKHFPVILYYVAVIHHRYRKIPLLLVWSSVPSILYLSMLNCSTNSIDQFTAMPTFLNKHS